MLRTADFPLVSLSVPGTDAEGRKGNDLFDGPSIIMATGEIPKLFLTSIETVSQTICFFLPARCCHSSISY